MKNKKGEKGEKEILQQLQEQESKPKGCRSGGTKA